MGGYTSGSVGHPCFLGAYIGGGLAIFEDSGPKIGFSNHGLRGPIIYFNGLEGCIYGIWVCLGDKTQLYGPKWSLRDEKPSKFDQNQRFLNIYRKIKIYSFNSWPYLTYNPCHFMAHFKPYIDHYYGPEGFGILRFMENFSHIPTFFGLRINGFRAENTIFSKN